MSKNAWDCTLELLVLMGNIDHTNELLSKTDNLTIRKILSDKIDAYETQLFELKNKLKKVTVI